MAVPMSRPPSKKPAPEAAAPAKMRSWDIHKLGSTPAKLLGHVDAPDEQSAIKQAINDSCISWRRGNRCHICPCLQGLAR
jgi:hypothetical protein